MSEYSVLLYIIIGIAVFIYFSWFITSLRIDKSKLNGASSSQDEFSFQKIVDPKNKQLGFLDLGNHVLFLGLIFIIIYISLNDKL
ncbi:MAG: hypothetical protein VW541_00190 [Pelagibacteraceae bacterium]